MADPTPPPTPAANHLLAALPRDEYEALRPHLDVLYLAPGTLIYGPGEAMAHAYFPLTGVASVIAAMAEGGMVEVGTVGREGFTALPLFHGTDRGPLTTIAQVLGYHARLPAAAFRAAVAEGSALHALLHRFAQAYSVLVAMSGGCNRLHPMEQRCARWLLLTHDRAGADTFLLTQEFLGYMLGVSRPSVTIAVGALQHAGFVAYQRGVLTVLDRRGLEAAACECYATIRDEFARLLGSAARR
jgi:CRP-like cAMP-binding protein